MRCPIKQATVWSGRHTGPERGALGEKFVVAHVVRSVTGKGQANRAVENINGCGPQIFMQHSGLGRIHNVSHPG